LLSNNHINPISINESIPDNGALGGTKYSMRKLIGNYHSYVYEHLNINDIKVTDTFLASVILALDDSKLLVNIKIVDFLLAEGKSIHTPEILEYFKKSNFIFFLMVMGYIDYQILSGDKVTREKQKISIFYDFFSTVNYLDNIISLINILKFPKSRIGFFVSYLNRIIYERWGDNGLEHLTYKKTYIKVLATEFDVGSVNSYVDVDNDNLGEFKVTQFGDIVFDYMQIPSVQIFFGYTEHCGHLNYYYQYNPGNTTEQNNSTSIPTFDITGSWEVAPYDRDGDNRITLQFNQSGGVVLGWYQKRVYNGVSVPYLIQRKFSAIFKKNDNSRTLFENFSGDYGNEASIIVSKRDNKKILIFINGSWNKEFIQIQNNPLLDDSIIESITNDNRRRLVQAFQRAPFDSKQIDDIDQLATNAKELINRYVSESGIGSGQTNEICRMINDTFKDYLEDFPKEQNVLIKLRLTQLLSEDTSGNEDTSRPYWDWLVALVYSKKYLLSDVSEALDIKVANGKELDSANGAEFSHHYNIKIMFMGIVGMFAITVGAFKVDAVIEKEEPNEKRIWSEQYIGGVGVLGTGLSVGFAIGKFIYAEGSSFLEYTPSNLNGPVEIVTSGAGASAGGGPSVGVGIVKFYGDGLLPPLILSTSIFSGESGLFASAGMDVLYGRLALISDGGEQEHIGPRYIENSPFIMAFGQNNVNFITNSSLLTDDGKLKIHVMCAKCRAFLEVENTIIHVDGFASTLDDEQHNCILSKNRAINVINEVINSMGDALKIPYSHISYKAHGERAARLSSVPDGVESQEWRTVNVIINGHLVLTI
jgi:hypothetical protein